MKRSSLIPAAAVLVVATTVGEAIARSPSSGTRSGRRATGKSRPAIQVRSGQSTRGLSQLSNRLRQRFTRPTPRPANRPRPQPKPTNGGIAGGLIRPRPLPKPFPTNGKGPVVRPRPGAGNGGGVVRPLPFPKPLPNKGGSGPIVGPKPNPGSGVVRPLPFPKPLPNKGGSGPIVPSRPRPSKGDGGKFVIQPFPNHGPVTRPRPFPKPHHGRGKYDHRWCRTNFCATRPRHCWWWVDYCPPVYNNPVVYDRVNLVQTVLQGPSTGGDPVETRWYLGISGAILPGKGLGIEAVEANSPAEAAGLAPGMVVTGVNGIPIVDDESLGRAILASGGVLRMEVVNEADGDVIEALVRMRRIATVSF